MLRRWLFPLLLGRHGRRIARFEGWRIPGADLERRAPIRALAGLVAPGPVWTPLVATTTDPDSLSEFGGDTMIGRAAQPAELAPAFVYLASPESSYVTGEVIAVTGGKFFGQGDARLAA